MKYQMRGWIVCVVCVLCICLAGCASFPSDSGDDETVYITKTGTKYHRAGCRYLDESKIAIDKADAIKQGYTACSVCKP